MKQQTTNPTATPPLAQPPKNGSVDVATLELLRSWRLQDATENQEEVRAAEEELAAFKRAMNQDRIAAGDSVLYP